MKYLPALLLSLALVSPLAASEPASGTIIQISGVSLWIAASSLFVCWKQMSPEGRRKVAQVVKFWQR